ncbi:DNAJ protein JJJ1 homolog isoform X2 [Typha angustifolia]|uniref:DNAJ protein JJJ1 homolog isoform X2 n=1 Tax=Typha angustifolia TaxID=59011 RepID=UPI003C2ED8A5
MAAQLRKRCLYEILGVSRDASQDDIRAAYKRLALQLHPDKVAASCGGAVSDSATAAFQELLNAYEVLSDPKERAYYDSHRSQILFSDLSSNSRDHSPFDLDLFSFFNVSVFSGYSDSGRGFYKVYGDLFSKVYSQELWFASQLGIPQDSISPAPLIGNLESPYEQVTAFYNYWIGFCTVMDFAWVDEYDASAGPNRRSRRAMEEENKKLRKKARRAYNDSVHGLAAFVRKRDKRVDAMMVKRNLEEEKKREEEKARKKEEERKKMERAQAFVEPEWTKVDEVEDFCGYDDGYDYDGKSKKKTDGGEELYCVICSKKFRSHKQWKNHEQSNKHKDKVAQVKMAFEKEDKILKEGEDQEKVHVRIAFDPPQESGSVEEPCEDFREDKILKEGGDQEKVQTRAPFDPPLESASVDEPCEDFREDKILKEGGDQEKVQTRAPFDPPLESASVDEPCEDFREDKILKEGGDQEKVQTRAPSDPPVESELMDELCGDFRDDLELCEGEVGVRSNEDRPNEKNRKIKKIQADIKSTTKKDTADDQKRPLKGKKKKAMAKAPSNACGTCGENFDSRNKLFAHLSDTGHATLKSR